MNSCSNTCCASVLSAWLRCSGFLEVGFYYWIKHRHKAIQREATRQELDTKVKDAFDNSKGRDGSRRIQKELSENGDSHDVKTIAASMKRQDLTPKAARKRTASIRCL